MALSASTIDRVKKSRFGRMAAISRLEQQVDGLKDIPYNLYSLNKSLFEVFDFENNGVETKEDLKILFEAKGRPLLNFLSQLETTLS